LERVPDIIVHAAGAFALERVESTSIETFDRMIAVNLRAAFLLMRAFIPGMRERDSGHFLSIGSIAGRVPLPGNGAYAASKFGLRGLHAVLNTELRRSEEHTSELQSRENLVCRLLLEKKKTT